MEINGKSSLIEYNPSQITESSASGFPFPPQIGQNSILWRWGVKVLRNYVQGTVKGMCIFMITTFQIIHRLFKIAAIYPKLNQAYPGEREKIQESLQMNLFYLGRDITKIISCEMLLLGSFASAKSCIGIFLGRKVTVLCFTADTISEKVGLLAFGYLFFKLGLRWIHTPVHTSTPTEERCKLILRSFKPTEETTSNKEKYIFFRNEVLLFKKLNEPLFDPHKMLGLKDGYTEEELLKAHKQIALAVHPDKNLKCKKEADYLFKCLRAIKELCLERLTQKPS